MVGSLGRRLLQMAFLLILLLTIVRLLLRLSGRRSRAPWCWCSPPHFSPIGWGSSRAS